MRRTLVPTMLLIAACSGGDGNTGPTPDPIPDVSGRWNLDVVMRANPNGLPLVCRTVIEAAVSQDGRSFSGNYSGGYQILCEYSGNIYRIEGVPGNIINGFIDSDRDIRFSLNDPQASHFEGVVNESGSSLNGSGWSNFTVVGVGTVRTDVQWSAVTF